MQGLSPICFESVSAVTLTPSVDIGTRRTVSGCDYVYVYNTGTDTAIVGGAVVFASSASGYSVAASAVTMTDLGVGIVNNVAIPTLSYGWVLTRGYAKFNAGASDSFAVGNPLAVAVSGAFGNKTICTGYMTPVVGKCQLVTASGLTGTGAAFFNFCI